MTVGELARRAGMTIRNVRAHQTRGLLPPPEISGRVAYYGPEHLARLRLVADLQQRGFNLGSIKSLLDAAPAGAAHEVLAFERALMAPWGPERPAVVDAAEVVDALGGNGAVVRRACDLGLVTPRADGRYDVSMPTLLRAARELARLGVPPEPTLDTLDALLRHARGIARAFVELFDRGVWRPFEARGKPPEQWPDVRAALERLRPLASDALSVAFHAAMERAVEEALAREMEREARARREAM
ncbi:MAG TPA: MerR family transcriptional regulator [Actinomycetota bacterium]|nr:MerR family transcriptional regulator [Actinomycetota bacterium]